MFDLKKENGTSLNRKSTVLKDNSLLFSCPYKFRNFQLKLITNI